MYLLKKIIPLLFLICTLYGTDVTPPTLKLQISGGATDMIATSTKIYIATALGRIDVFNKDDKKFIRSIKLKKIKDFVGDMIESKIYSLDKIDDQLLIVSQGEKGGRNIFLYKEDTLETVVSDTQRLFIAQAKFLNKNQIIYATLSNELILYDLQQNKELFKEQVSHSKFSYFVLNEVKTKLIVADESGNLKIVNAYNGQIQTTLKNQNLDNIFQVDWKNDIILTAGQDRRSVLYSTNTMQPYVRKSDFLIYGCALSEDGKLAAYSSDEQNNVLVYDTNGKEDLFMLIDNAMTITKILFLNNHEVLVATDACAVNYYKLH